MMKMMQKVWLWIWLIVSITHGWKILPSRQLLSKSSPTRSVQSFHALLKINLSRLHMSSEEKTEITEKPSSTEQQPPSQLHTPPITPTTISTSIPIKNKKSENVNLFAADDRRTPLSLGPSTKSSSSLPPSMPVMGNPMSSAISSTTRNNLMESQAEIYKLEAEKEQVQIDQERIADKKKMLMELDQLILRLWEGKFTVDEVVVQHKNMLCKEFFFRLAELANAANGVERDRFFELYEEVSKKLEEVDPGLSASVKADIQKDLNTELNRYQSNGPTKSEAGQTYEQAVQQWLKQIANNSNATVVSQIFDNMNSNVVMDNSNKNGSVVDIMNARMVRFPPALPLNMLPLVLRGSSLNQADIGLVVDAVFNSSGLSNVKIDCSSYIITATGNPTVSLHKSYNQLVAAIEKIPGLSDRVRVFLLPEYRIPLQTPSNRSMTEKYSNKRFEPVFIVLPKEAKPKPPKGWEYSAAAVSVLATAVTTFIFSTDVNALNAEFLQKALAGDTSVVNSVLAITAGIIGLQAMHDLGHFAASKAYNIKMSFPSFLLPSLQIGNFGSVTRFLDFPKNRKQLFDISIAGPLFGFVSSLLCFLSGVYMTSHASTEILSTFPELPAGFFKSSLLIYQLLESALHISTASSNIAGANGAGSLVPIHPLAIVGMVGLLSNALNFMPIGRLDGGRVAMAVGGRQSANDITFGTLLAQAISFVTSVNNPVQLFWIIAVVFLQRGSDHPPENDVTAIGDEEADGSKGIMWYGRLASLLFCMVLTAGILLPVPTDFSSITSSMNQFPPLNGPTI